MDREKIVWHVVEVYFWMWTEISYMTIIEVIFEQRLEEVEGAGQWST